MISIINNQLVQTTDVASSSISVVITSAELKRQYDEILAAIKQLDASLIPLETEIKVATELEAKVGGESVASKR
jgi:hypothetical protein